MTKWTNRTAWGLAGVLALGVLGGTGWLGNWLRACWVAKYHGEGADLQNAALMYAPLSGANLAEADLRNANLRGAHLRAAFLDGADLTNADLTGADLRGVLTGYIWRTRRRPTAADWRDPRTGQALAKTRLAGAWLCGADLRGARLGGVSLHA